MPEEAHIPPFGCPVAMTLAEVPKQPPMTMGTCDLGLRLDYDESWTNVEPPKKKTWRALKRPPPLDEAEIFGIPLDLSPQQTVGKTLVVTHVECKNHITPAGSGLAYLGEKHVGISPEQPERVTAVFEALKDNCTWECGGKRVVDTIELETSPTLGDALDENMADWASGNDEKRRLFGPPERTTSVAYLFDDLEPIVLSVHDKNYLSRVANDIETMVKDESLMTRATSTSVDSIDTSPKTASTSDSPGTHNNNNHGGGFFKTAPSSSLTDDDEDDDIDDDDETPVTKKRASSQDSDEQKKLKLYRCVSVTATGDTFASARSLHAAVCASYAVCRAVDAVVSSKYRNAFCCVRPPGHHAGSAGSTMDDNGDLVGQGFCLLNHVAVGARYALANHGQVAKVAVIDWDLHHGNGTAQVFCADDGPMARDALRDSVLFCSIHGATPPDTEPHLFPGTARSPTVSDNAVNVPLPPGAGHAEFIEKFSNVVVPAIEAFEPDLILISAGFDGHKDDLFKFLKLTDKTFKLLTEIILDLADCLCNGRVVSVLEGGYSIPTLVKCCTQHVRTLATYHQPFPVVNAKTSRVASSCPTVSTSSSSTTAAGAASSRTGRYRPPRPHYPTPFVVPADSRLLDNHNHFPTPSSSVFP